MAYIERDKAIAYVEEQYRLFRNEEDKQAIIEGCVEALKFTPTADVVEVVRCEKCAFYDIEDYNCREFDCNMPCDGYCSKGTPKERGGEK